MTASAKIRQAPLFLTCAVFALVAVETETQACDAAMFDATTIDIQEVSHWLKRRFSAAELEMLTPQDSRVELYSCSCYDIPDSHFPYRIVLFITPKGDLVGRPDGAESAVRITPLAVRNGNLYCESASEDRCYGTFAHPCDFTDFRYGPYLQSFFPLCKMDETATGFPLH